MPQTPKPRKPRTLMGAIDRLNRNFFTEDERRVGAFIGAQERALEEGLHRFGPTKAREKLAKRAKRTVLTNDDLLQMLNERQRKRRGKPGDFGEVMVP